MKLCLMKLCLMNPPSDVEYGSLGVGHNPSRLSQGTKMAVLDPGQTASQIGGTQPGPGLGAKIRGHAASRLGYLLRSPVSGLSGCAHLCTQCAHTCAQSVHVCDTVMSVVYMHVVQVV